MSRLSLFRDLFWVLLFPIAVIWAGVAYLRRLILRPRYLSSLPVLCVGNLHSGGSGKTPLVAGISNHFQSRKVAVLSRGYKGELEDTFGRVELDESQGARRYGDEPWMLAHLITHPIFVGKNRVEAVKKIEGAGDFSGVLLDDGFQHLALAKTVSLVVIDVNRSLDEAYCLPLGELREPLSSLCHAQGIVLTGVEQEAAANRWRAYLSERFPGTAVFSAKLVLHLPPPAFSGARFGVFCGIAAPERFETALRGKSDFVWLRSFPDHHAYTEGDLDWLVRAKAEKGVTQLLTTEKDYFKVADRLSVRGEALSRVRIEYDLSADFWYFLENRWMSK